MGKIGLVFAGGGGKGAYQIGVWKAFREFGVDKNIGDVAGTSVGALNATLFAYGNYELAEGIWKNIRKDQIMTPKMDRIFAGFLGRYPTAMTAYFVLAAKVGIFSREGLNRIIDNHLDLNAISSLPRNVYAGAYNWSQKKMEYMNINHQRTDMIKRILRATSAIPVMFPPEKINGNEYYDGGLPFVGDNIPVDPLYGKGYSFIFVVHLGQTSLINNEEKYKFTKIIEIVPSSDLGSFADGTLDFSQEGARRRIEAGYQDTLKILKPIYEMGMLQQQINATLNEMKEHEADYNNQKKILAEKHRDVDARYEELKKRADRIRKG